MKVSGQRSAAPMGSERRCRKAEALCARPSEKNAKNEDAGQTGLKKITEEKRRNRKRKKGSRMRKKHDKKAGNKQEQQRSAYFRYLRGDDRGKQNIAEMNNNKTGRCWQNGSISTARLLN